MAMSPRNKLQEMVLGSIFPGMKPDIVDQTQAQILSRIFSGQMGQGASPTGQNIPIGRGTATGNAPGEKSAVELITDMGPAGQNLGLGVMAPVWQKQAKEAGAGGGGIDSSQIITSTFEDKAGKSWKVGHNKLTGDQVWKTELKGKKASDRKKTPVWLKRAGAISQLNLTDKEMESLKKQGLMGDIAPGGQEFPFTRGKWAGKIPTVPISRITDYGVVHSMDVSREKANKMLAGASMIPGQNIKNVVEGRVTGVKAVILPPIQVRQRLSTLAKGLEDLKQENFLTKVIIQNLSEVAPELVAALQATSSVAEAEGYIREEMDSLIDMLPDEDKKKYRKIPKAKRPEISGKRTRRWDRNIKDFVDVKPGE